MTGHQSPLPLHGYDLGKSRFSLIVLLVRAAFVAGSWLCACLLLNGATLAPPWREPQPYVLLGGVCILNGLLLISCRPVLTLQPPMGSAAEAVIRSTPTSIAGLREWTYPLRAFVLVLSWMFAAGSWLLAIITLSSALLQPALDRQALLMLGALSVTNALLLHPRSSKPVGS